jgi:hypothetical protein
MELSHAPVPTEGHPERSTRSRKTWMAAISKGFGFVDHPCRICPGGRSDENVKFEYAIRLLELR